MDFISKFHNFLGVIGVVAILWSYFALQVGSWAATSWRYLLANLIGSVLILISLLYDWNLASFVIEVAWILISGLGIYKRCQRSN